jgi:hypothetical protein
VWSPAGGTYDELATLDDEVSTNVTVAAVIELTNIRPIDRMAEPRRTLIRTPFLLAQWP